MRNYRFRGWSKLQQEWIYGSLITSPKSGEIYIGNSSVSEPVEPGSVGQLTGFWTDDLRNIYEGDILLINDGEEETAYNVLWDEVKAMWCGDDESGYTHPLFDFSMKGYSIQIVGNQWERKEREETRNYRFRGWSKWEQKWIYGNLIGACGVGDIYIGNADFFEPVELESIGQYTECWTEDVKDIYEGDILQMNDGSGNECYTIRWDLDTGMWCGDNGDGRLHALCNLPIESQRMLIVGNEWEKRQERK